MMEANVYENEFKVKKINSHLRSWENAKKIINGNFLGTFLDSNYLDFKVAFGIFNSVYRANLEDTNNLNQVISVVQSIPTFNMFLLHKNIKLYDLISEYSKSVINKGELEELLSNYFTFHINFCLENRQNSFVSYKYNRCFNLQGQTDFLIDFSKEVENKTLFADLPRAQQYADNETKRIITIWQLVAFYEHNWLNSSKAPDEATCKFGIAIDSLLSEDQSDKLSHIINVDTNELNEAERNLRKQFFSQDFRDMVINYWESTFLELTNFVEEINGKDNDGEIIKLYKIDLNNLPDKNRFQKIMYFPDKDLTPDEILFRNIFFQEAAKRNNLKRIKDIINSLRMPIKIEMPEEFQNMMKIIDETNFNYKIEDYDIYDNFLNQFFETFVSREQILQDILNGNYIGSEQEFENIIETLFRNYDDEKKKNIIFELLSSESKLRVDFKSKLLFENLELLKDENNQIVTIFPNDDFLNELYSGNLNNIYFVTIIEVIFLKFPIEENSDKIMHLLSLKSKLNYEAKKCLLYNFFEIKLKGKENFNLLDVINDERLSIQEKNLILVYKKGSGFLKSCYEDINVINNFETKEEFSQALYFKLNLYQQSKQLKILKLLLSEKSKLSDEIKQSLQINYFELIPGSIKKLARNELPLNKETLFKFYKKLFFICKNNPKKIFNLLQKIVNDDKTIPILKKIIYQNVNRVLYLFKENKSDRQEIFQDILNTLPNENDFDYSIDYSNEFKFAVKPLSKNFDKSVFESKKDENLIPPLIYDEHNLPIRD